MIDYPHWLRVTFPAMWLEIAGNAILITSNDIQIILFGGPQSSPK
jgi:hypothetical protein